VLVPPQSTVSVEDEASHVAVQPVRPPVPSVMAAPMKEPSMAMSVVPLSAQPVAELQFPPAGPDARVMLHAVWRMHWRAVSLVSPHPCPLSATE
jgi:hypothetical protein